LGATAVGLTGAPGLQCGGEAMTSVTTTHAKFGPKGTAAENILDLSDKSMFAVTFSFRGACWAADTFYFSGRPRSRAQTRLPRGLKRLAKKRRASNAHRMQKRATQARAGRGNFLLPALSLALGATAVGLTGAPGLQCGGEAMTSVTTTHAKFGPKGTAAENSKCRMG